MKMSALPRCTLTWNLAMLPYIYVEYTLTVRLSDIRQSLYIFVLYPPFILVYTEHDDNYFILHLRTTSFRYLRVGSNLTIVPVHTVY